MVLTVGLTLLFQAINVPTNLCNVWWSIWRLYETFKISENVKQLDFVKMIFCCIWCQE